MQIEENCIISPDGFDKYGVNGRCRASRERVEDFVKRDLMSQESVYKRYTEELSERLTSLRRSEQPGVVRDIRQSFAPLRDPDTGYISEEEFKRVVTKRLAAWKVDDPSHGAALLFEILTHYAFFPFPLRKSDSGKLHIDEDAFVRAICLLTLDVSGQRGSEPMPATHRCISGAWGPYHGWYISVRGKDSSDFRRWLFHSLAVPDRTRESRATTVSVPRFVWYESDDEGDGAADDAVRQVALMEDESELTVDIVDVLSECPPEVDTLTANPFRESYRVALSDLPQQSEDLSVLVIPTAKLVSLVKLVEAVQHGDFGDLVSAVERADEDGEISWEGFDLALSKHTKFIAHGLAVLMPCSWVDLPPISSPQNGG